MGRFTWIATLAISMLAATARGDDAGLPSAKPVGEFEVVARFQGPMPTGVSVSHEGRIFVCFPRWGDPVEFTVAELKNGQTVAFPDEAINRINHERPVSCLMSVQSVVVDPQDRLWLLDTGSVEFGPPVPGGPKLIGIDLKDNKIFKS